MSIRPSSSTLLAFYKDWLEFAKSENPQDHTYFDPGCGLCSNCHFWSIEHHLLHMEIEYEMHCQFADAGVDSDYPFGGEEQYTVDVSHDIAIYNPMRLAWVTDRITEVEGEQ